MQRASLALTYALSAACAAGALAQPATPPVDPARAEADVRLLCELVAGPDAWQPSSRYLLDAAGSRDDVIRFITQQLHEQPDHPCAPQFGELLARHQEPDALAGLAAFVATPSTDRARQRSHRALLLRWLAGPDFAASFEDLDEAEKQRAQEDDEWYYRQLGAWFRQQGPADPQVMTQQTRRELNTLVFSVVITVNGSREALINVMEGTYNAMSLNLYVLRVSADGRTATTIMMETLRPLHALAIADPPDECDRQIALLEDLLLRELQTYVGAAHLPDTERTGRADTRARAGELLAWWEPMKEGTPLEWKMRRLAERGYKTTPNDTPREIGAELLRAVQSTPQDALTASAILRELGLSQGIVPIRDCDHTRVADAYVRGTVLSEAGANLLRGYTPVWDQRTRTWTAVKP